MVAVIAKRPSLGMVRTAGEVGGLSPSDPFAALSAAPVSSALEPQAQPATSSQLEASTPPTPFSNPFEARVFEWLNLGGPINRGTVFEFEEMLSVHTLERQQLEAVRAHLAEVALETRNALKQDPYDIELNERHDLCLRLNAATFASRTLRLPSVASVVMEGVSQELVPAGRFLRVEEGGASGKPAPEGRIASGDHPLLLVVNGDVPDKSAA